MKQKLKVRIKTKLRKNDMVVVISGKDRGRQGRILRVLPATGRVIIERVNMIKRHTRPNPGKNIAGGISEREAAIHISNVMLVDPDRNVRTRIGLRRDADGNPERVAKKSGAVLA
jgi:large subunit ribosomal protein L24